MQERNRNPGRLLMPALGTAALIISSSASAGVISGSSSGTGLSVDLNIAGSLTPSADLGSANVNVSPSNPSATDSGSFADLDVDANVPGILNASASADVITGNASANINDPANAMGDAEITGLQANATSTGLPDTDSLLSLDSNTISSNASVTGDFGTLTPTGDSTLDITSLSVLGNTVDADVLADAAPNTDVLPTILDPLGVDLLLNEQITSTSDSQSSITVNALRLTLNDFNNGGALGGVLNGDIILAQSQASLTAQQQGGGTPAPAPSVLLLLGSGLAGVGFVKRKKRQAV